MHHLAHARACTYTCTHAPDTEHRVRTHAHHILSTGAPTCKHHVLSQELTCGRGITSARACTCVFVAKTDTKLCTNYTPNAGANTQPVTSDCFVPCIVHVYARTPTLHTYTNSTSGCLNTHMPPTPHTQMCVVAVTTTVTCLVLHEPEIKSCFWAFPKS